MVDADAIVHELLERKAVKHELLRAFGPRVLDSTGRVDRSALAVRGFRNARAVGRLNRILHPRVRREMRRRLRQSRGTVVLDVPLLAEAGIHRWCDALVYVHAPAAVRAARLRHRGWSPAEARRRQAWQYPPTTKRRLANYVLENDGPLARTRHQVRRLWDRLAARLPLRRREHAR